jgi:hypothetical protein
VKGLLITLALCVPACLPTASIGTAVIDVSLGNGCLAHFATASEAAEILARKDDFIQRLSPFDRSARMKTDKNVSVEEFLAFVKTSASTWTDAEKGKVEAAIGRIGPALEVLSLPLPKTVALLKTTGNEEGHAFYTRDTAIVFPENQLTAAADAPPLEKTIAHELFHILSRENPAMREALYHAIGFTPCAEVQLPTPLQPRKITNPDAPRNDHSIRLQVDGKEVAAVPMLLSATEKYDAQRGGEFFSYMQLQFLILENRSGGLGGGEVVAPSRVSQFFEQVGRNTDYVIHPEEILAENFALLVLNEQKVASPAILQRMREILTRH